MQLLQVFFQLHRHAESGTQLLGETGATLQRRTHQAIPGPALLDSRVHLLPAPGGQGIVEAATQAAALLGFAVTQQVQAQGHAGRSATAASAKVAICP
ncbi:hypothetical protein D9M68_973480 [compost metagenome]